LRIYYDVERLVDFKSHNEIKLENSSSDDLTDDNYGKKLNKMTLGLCEHGHGQVTSNKTRKPS